MSSISLLGQTRLKKFVFIASLLDACVCGLVKRSSLLVVSLGYIINRMPLPMMVRLVITQHCNRWQLDRKTAKDYFALS